MHALKHLTKTATGNYFKGLLTKIFIYYIFITLDQIAYSGEPTEKYHIIVRLPLAMELFYVFSLICSGFTAH